MAGLAFRENLYLYFHIFWTIGGGGLVTMELGIFEISKWNPAITPNHEPSPVKRVHEHPQS